MLSTANRKNLASLPHSPNFQTRKLAVIRHWICACALTSFVGTATDSGQAESQIRVAEFPRIYNDIVERWFPAFNKRGQMRHALPYRLVGEIRLLEGRGLGGRDMATIACWNEWADDVADSGVFIEMGPKNQDVDETI